ncbi:crustapain-like [Lycorma delicatula]|uniref:crustapain-like n=1 Tax=Lycorma delicatula TaxID=130591 RepID=UPI003F512937
MFPFISSKPERCILFALYFICFSVIFSIYNPTLATASPVEKVPDEADYNWENYKKNFNRNYVEPNEEAERHNIFIENVKIIKEHNKKYSEGTETYIQGVNQFTDRKPEELKHLTGLRTKKH